MQIYDISINHDKMETTRHGTDEFPLAIYETTLAHNVLGFIDWHWHNELQFCVVANGQIQLTVNQTVYLLSAGMGIFINANVLHMAKPLTPEAAYHCLDVHPTLISAFPGSIIETGYIGPFLADPARSAAALSPDIAWQNTILEQLKSIHSDYLQKPAGYELSVTSRLMHCMRILICEIMPADYQPQTSASGRLKELTGYIHAHYKEKITLSQLSGIINLCPNECCRYFKKHMQCTIFDYINNLRISKSSEALLNAPDLSISQISYEYGFSTTSYFIQKFKKATGMTPNQFRRKSLKTGCPVFIPFVYTT